MAVIDVTYYTDPACPWSWAAEPAVRRVLSEFAGEVTFTYVMGGLARQVDDPVQHARHTLDASAESGMPVDARVWLDGAPKSSYPASLAVKAAAEQGLDGPYLRGLREALFCERRAMDTAAALVDLARRVPGLDVERFRIDLESNAIVEAFGADLERARGAADDDERVSFPTFDVGGRLISGGEVRPLREAVAGAGAAGAGPPPGIEEALHRFGRMAAPEVAAVCDLARARAVAELWRLATEMRVRFEPVGGSGELWSLAA